MTDALQTTLLFRLNNPNLCFSSFLIPSSAWLSVIGFFHVWTIGNQFLQCMENRVLQR